MTVRKSRSATSPTAPNGAELPMAGSKEQSVKKVRILVVDDCRDTTDILATLLRRIGCEVKVAYDGLLAVAVAATFRPHLAFVDMAMPGFTGLQFAKQIRENSDLANMMLVAVSGYVDEHTRELAESAGFNRFLAKPSPFGQISGIIEPLSNVLQSVASQP